MQYKNIVYILLFKSSCSPSRHILGFRSLLRDIVLDVLKGEDKAMDYVSKIGGPEDLTCNSCKISTQHSNLSGR